MGRVLVFLLCSLLILSDTAGATAEIDQFLASRQLVAQIFFAHQSTQLSVTAMQQLDRIASELHKYNMQKMLIRAEGFASPDGDNDHNLNLSLQRALAVTDYLLRHQNLQLPVFLTGFGETRLDTENESALRRVDIAVYTSNRAAEILFDTNGKSERFILP